MKSNVSDHLEIAQFIYIDACAKCDADVSDLRDLETLRSRVNDEGISFLTITLPQFCQDFERSLATGVIDPTGFRNFRKTGSIPAFLQGMIGRIFNRETGRIYDKEHEPQIPVFVDCIRQICLAFKKIEIRCSPEREATSIQNFISIEHSLSEISVPAEALEFYSSVSAVLWDNIMASLRLDMLVPRHGPGATAERISGNSKYVWQYWHDRLEPYFPVLGNAYTISAYQDRGFDKLTIIAEQDEQPVRVVLVPKTLKAPRVIAIEPCCMQYAQQALRSLLYDAIEGSLVTSGHINFRDQSVNQQLAMSSSADGRFGTIDLSDASDRVPRDLAMEMFRANPDLRDSIEACRSRSASLPDGRVIPDLKKFASMGSALCFPIESMYFYTICVAALLEFHNLPVSYANVFDVSRGIYVYGDDIIVPIDAAPTVLAYLQKYNCKVNTSKTFVTGRFRESCGVDAYDGELVTPTYLRHLRPQNRQQASNLISWVATANSFYKRGYWRTAAHMFLICERILGPLPYVSETSSGLGRVSYLGYCSIERWNSKLHRFEVKAWVPRPVYRSDSIDGYAALTKSLLGGHRPDDPIDPLHLERSALHGAVTLQRHWVPLH